VNSTGGGLFSVLLKASGDPDVKFDKWDPEDLTTKDKIVVYVD
jgi:hypothetical protein